MTRFIEFQTTYGSTIIINIDHIIAFEKSESMTGKFELTYVVITTGQASFRITAETYRKFEAALEENWIKYEQSK